MSSPKRRAREQHGREYTDNISTHFEFPIFMYLLVVEAHHDKPPGYDEPNQDSDCCPCLDHDSTTAKNALNIIASVTQYKNGLLLMESVVVTLVSS